MNRGIEFKYRIIYESLSRFSSSLSKCRSFEAVALCQHTNLKYILDYLLLRFTFYVSDLSISYTLTNKHCSYERGSLSQLWKQENFFLSRKVPTVIPAEKLFIDELNESTIILNEEPREIWGWNFEFQPKSGIIVTLVTSDSKTFTRSDIPVLKLIVENLYSNLLALKLVEDLDVKKNELETTLIQLKQTNQTIRDIVNTQDIVIEERTAEIREKNKKLLEISKLNAHNVREPLSRTLGILSIIDYCSHEETINEWLPLLHQSFRDFDNALNQTIDFVDKEIKQANNYETKNYAG